MTEPYWEPLAGVPLPPVLPLTYGTSFPSSPVDGQEHVLVDSTTAPTWQWRFRYNAASTYAYKWEFIGGAPARSSGGSVTVPTTGAMTDITGGPTFLTPRPGLYRVRFGASVYNAGTFTGAYQSQIVLHIGSTSTGAYAELRHHSNTYDGAQIMMDTETTAVAAGMQFNLKASEDRAGSNTTINNVWMIVEPVRLS